jgi:hypothetical protein
MLQDLCLLEIKFGRIGVEAAGEWRLHNAANGMNSAR